MTPGCLGVHTEDLIKSGGKKDLPSGDEGGPAESMPLADSLLSHLTLEVRSNKDVISIIYFILFYVH